MICREVDAFDVRGHGVCDAAAAATSLVRHRRDTADGHPVDGRRKSVCLVIRRERGHVLRIRFVACPRSRQLERP